MTQSSRLFLDPSGVPCGEATNRKQTRLDSLVGVFTDDSARSAMPAETLVYDVAWHQPVKIGTEGGLLFGWTEIQPGRVGDEYFMTRGHFHAARHCAEYYWHLSGEGLLLLMDADRQCRVEAVSERSLHYIPGHVAHRMINTGDKPFRFGACWPADAGHDYDTIKKRGFGVRVFARGSQPEIVKVD